MNAYFRSDKNDIAALQESAKKATVLLRALGNENRLRILCLLAQHGELSPSEMQPLVGLGQSALSQHLMRMREEGIIAYQREAQTLYYRIVSADAKKIMETLKNIYCP